MKIQVESTTEIAAVEGARVRLWRGTTGRGVPITAAIARIGVDAALDASELESALDEFDGGDGLEAQLRARAHVLQTGQGLLEKFVVLEHELESMPDGREKRSLLALLTSFALYIQTVHVFLGEET